VLGFSVSAEYGGGLVASVFCSIHKQKPVNMINSMNEMATHDGADRADAATTTAAPATRALGHGGLFAFFDDHEWELGIGVFISEQRLGWMIVACGDTNAAHCVKLLRVIKHCIIGEGASIEYIKFWLHDADRQTAS
jgi:hypothetical protein